MVTKKGRPKADIPVSGDLTGKKINSLTVLSFDGYRTNAKSNQLLPYWKCKCECGNICYVRNYSFIRKPIKKRQKSCGCKRWEGIKNGEKLFLPEGDAAFNALYNTYKRRSKNKIDITKKEFKILTKASCFYCGSLPNTYAKTIQDKKYNKNGYCYNGLDRIDSSKGYVKENVVTCCIICNRAKNNLNIKDFINWITQISEYSKKVNYKGYND